MKTTDLKSFHYLENGYIDFSALDTVKSSSKLDPGTYKVGWLPYPHDRIELKQLSNLEAMDIQNFQFKDKIDKFVSSFFNRSIAEFMTNIGLNHKAGILFYGKEGTGKTSIIKHYCQQLIQEQDAVVFHITEITYIENVWDFVTKVRNVQMNPIVVVFDEFEGLTKNRESYVKSILDGSVSINNSVIFAATNYIDEVPMAIRNRPSRFKYVLEIGAIQSKEEIVPIVTKMLSTKFTTEDIEGFSLELQRHTLDEIKQFCMDKVMDIERVGNTRIPIGFKV